MIDTSALGNLRVGQIVSDRPETARIFEKHRIDYCCKGGKTLDEACREHQLACESVCEEIAHVPDMTSNDDSNWQSRSLTELCQHIERRHHDYLREELPRLTNLIDKVVDAHGSGRPELLEVRASFQRLRAELEPHMRKEEQVLFPAIRHMEARGRAVSFPFGSVQNPIRCMVHEHDCAGDELARLRELTHDYRPPENACPTYRVMLSALAQLELDLHQHIHKENNILFPRAEALERQWA